MKHFVATLIAILSIVLLPYFAYSQQAEAPVYKDGDSWRVKVEETLPPGASASGRCFTEYTEYLVKIVGHQPRVFGVDGNRYKPINCPLIVLQLLGKSVLERDKEIPGAYLKFPIHVGLAWSSRFYLDIMRQWIDARYEVQAWERIRTANNKVDAFRIVMTFNVSRRVRSSERVNTYYYSPKLKAIILFRDEDEEIGFVRTMTLVNSNVK
jgi:hypothetical protein